MPGTSPVVQWAQVHPPGPGNAGSIPGAGRLRTPRTDKPSEPQAGARAPQPEKPRRGAPGAARQEQQLPATREARVQQQRPVAPERKHFLKIL